MPGGKYLSGLTPIVPQNPSVLLEVANLKFQKGFGFFCYLQSLLVRKSETYARGEVFIWSNPQCPPEPSTFTVFYTVDFYTVLVISPIIYIKILRNQSFGTFLTWVFTQTWVFVDPEFCRKRTKKKPGYT